MKMEIQTQSICGRARESAFQKLPGDAELLVLPVCGIGLATCPELVSIYLRIITLSSQRQKESSTKNISRIHTLKP